MASSSVYKSRNARMMGGMCFVFLDIQNEAGVSQLPFFYNAPFLLLCAKSPNCDLNDVLCFRNV